MFPVHLVHNTQPPLIHGYPAEDAPTYLRHHTWHDHHTNEGAQGGMKLVHDVCKIDGVEIVRCRPRLLESTRVTY